LTTALEGGERSVSRPGRSLLPEKTQYPLYRRLCWPQGWSGHVRKISPPPGFDSRTVQPVSSRYKNCATRPTLCPYTALIYSLQSHPTYLIHNISLLYSLSQSFTIFCNLQILYLYLTYLLTCLLTYLLAYLFTYLLTYLLHRSESFLRS
jgi:hypothetical protein